MDYVLKDLGHVGDVRRGLEDRSASCGNGSHQRLEEEVEGVIPRSDDEYGTERLADDAAPRREELDRSLAILGCCPRA